ncbi:MAG TPA: hypothetical protein VFQ41_23765 [Candidatus Angelobacter sp.]|nr:hypothetical protein [Candidatus Angelobacter sp.]
MQWFRRYWEVLVPISLTLALALFELVEHFTASRAEVPPQVFLWLVLVFLVSISAQVAKLERRSLEHVKSELVREHSSGNPYVERIIHFYADRLNNLLEAKAFTTTYEGQASAELVRALELCSRGDTVCAISYRIAWTTSFHDYLQATLAVHRRGVAVTRVFLIPSDWVKPRNSQHCNESKANWEAVKQQARCGIQVKYLKETEMPYTEFFATHDKGMVIFRYGAKNATVMYDTAPAEGRPFRLDISWKPETVADQQEYFRRILDLKDLLHNVPANANSDNPPWLEHSTGAEA